MRRICLEKEAKKDGNTKKKEFLLLFVYGLKKY